MYVYVSAIEEILADDVENNRIEDTDAVDGVRALGDRIDNLSLLVRFDASVECGQCAFVEQEV